MFTGKTKPIRTIGSPDNQLPDKWSSTVCQKNLTVFKFRYIGNRLGWDNAVAMEQWTAQHRAFVVEAYLKNGDSAVTTQRLFLRHFNIPRHGHVPCRNTIKEWVQNFRENALAIKRKPQGRIPTVRTPENVDKVRMAIVKSPRRSADCSVRTILHKDLNFHPYKIAIVQELSDHDMADRRISFEQLLEMLNDDGVINTVLMTDEAISTCQVM